MNGGRFGRPAVLLAAIAAAAAAQAVVHTHPRLSLAGFAVGILLFSCLVRLRPAIPEPEASSPTPISPIFWVLFGLGCGVCALAGLAVYWRLGLGVTHGLWFVGLALLAASTLVHWCGVRTPLPARRTIVACALLLCVTSGLFAWRLTTVPPGVHGDDAEVGNDAIQLLEERPVNLFRTAWFHLPILHAAPTALGLKLFGINLAGLRGTSVVLGIASVLLLFAVAQRLWGFEVALLSGLILAFSRYFIHLSRAGFHYIDTAFLSLLVVWLFLRVWYDHRLAAAVWCGIALGLGIQTYYASRLVPILLVLTWAFWMIRSDPQLRRVRTMTFAVIVVAALATAAPMIGHFSNHWGDLWARTRGTSVFSEGARLHLAHSYGTDNLFAIVGIHLRKTLPLFNANGDTSLQYGYGAPMFDPITAVLFVLGLAGFCARPVGRPQFLGVLWLVVPVIVGGVLTIDAPFYPRVTGAVPFAVLAAACGLAHILECVRGACAGTIGSRLAQVLATVTVLVVAAINVRTYFVNYAPNHRLAPGVQISEWVRENGAGGITYMVGGAPAYYIKHGTIRFLTHGYVTRDIVDLDRYLQSSQLDPVTSRFVVMPQGKTLLPRLTEAVGPVDVEPQYDAQGQVVFYGVIPRTG